MFLSVTGSVCIGTGKLKLPGKLERFQQQIVQLTKNTNELRGLLIIKSFTTKRAAQIRTRN